VKPYAEGWKQYRKYLREWLTVWLGGVPVILAIAEGSLWLFHTGVPAQIAALGWLFLFAATGIRFQTFHCPRCGNWFAAKWWYNKSFLAQKCVHCGLPKFSDDGN
jgi:hypothetical protein